MLNLIQNEWMKLWNKKGTWVMVGLMIIFTSGMLFLMKWIDTQRNNWEAQPGDASISVQVDVDDSGWKESAESDLAYTQARLSEEGLSKVERKELEGNAKVLEYRLANSIEPIDEFSREGLIKNPSSISGTVLLLTVIVAAGIVASEFSQGTIKMLLTRPVKRWKILTSKFITVNLFSIFLILVGYVLYIALSMILFKSGAGQELAWNGKEVVEVSVWGKSLYMLLLSFGSVFITASFAFAVGSVFRSSSLAIGLSLFIYFTGSTITMMLSKYEVAKYLLFTHMDLTVYETGMHFIPGISLTFSLAVVAVYIVVFLAISYTTFIKRDVTA
ncbi:ABC transporter permease [Sporosarcina sp. USHLN248]|uniref:ABC transporter permease n=1 Tax=Sporosarcina sp. USHLN248 TaxID=3081300 RepID=UPI0030170D40